MEKWKMFGVILLFLAAVLVGFERVDRVMKQENPGFDSQPAFAIHSQGVTVFGETYALGDTQWKLEPEQKP